MSLVTVSAAEYECPAGNPGKYLVQYSNGKKCYSTFQTALDGVKSDETAEIVFLDNGSWDSSNHIIDKNITINLNENTLTFGNGTWTIKGANVTIKNGTITTGTTSRINVDASAKATTLNFANDVTVSSNSEAAHNVGAVVKVVDATKAAVVNINGTWEVANELVDCDPGKNKNLTINLNAKVTANELVTDALVSLDAGTTVVNVNGGSYTAKTRVFDLKNGTLNINAGTLKAVEKAVVRVNAPDTKYTNVLNIKGGELTSESDEWETVVFNTEKGTYSISGGSFKSGKDKDGKQLPALRIYSITDFLANHKGMITKGTFTGSIVGQTQNEDGRYVEAEDAAKILVGNAT